MASNFESPLQITRRISQFRRYRMRIVDNGSEIWATLSNPNNQDPKSYAYIETDDKTSSLVQSAKMGINPFIVPERLMETEQTQQAVESYTRCANALLYATLTIENTPFPTDLATLVDVEIENSQEGIEASSGLRIFGPKLTIHHYPYPQGARRRPPLRLSDEAWKRMEKNASKVGQEAQEAPPKTPIEIFVGCGSRVCVALDMGYGFGDSVLSKDAHVWEGSLTLGMENYTILGTIGV